LYQETTWRTAPNVMVLGSIGDLLADLAQLFPNGVLLDTICKACLVSLEEDDPINFSKKSHDVFRDSVSTTVRQCFMKIRDLKRVGGVYQTAIKKAR
jgi:hypothetical protein